MKKKTLVIGKGFAGKPLAEYLNATVCKKRLKELTVDDIKSFDTVINTAAKTAIDWCEENKNQSFQTNVVDALHLARIINKANEKKDKKSKIKHVFFSSGCIFKSSGYNDVNFEDDIPSPQCFYTETKVMVEHLIRENDPSTLIIRPRLLISEKSHPRNTLDKLLTYDKIVDTQESATVLEDMIPRVKELIEKDFKGPVHVFNAGTISPSQIMNVFDHPHERISKQELDEMTKDKAQRVTTVLGSKYNAPLHDIRVRIKEIAENWS